MEGETPRARVEVERVDIVDAAGRQRWDEESFFKKLDAGAGPRAVRELATNLRDLAPRFRETVSLAWGTGKVEGSMVLKRNDNGLIEVFTSGEVRFRPSKFVPALGPDVGRE